VRGYLAILALGLALPAAFFVGVLLWQFAAAERARLEERVPGTARAIARALDRELAGLIATLEVLSLSAPLQAGDLEGFHARAVTVQRRAGIAVVLRDLAGQQLVNSRRAWGETLPRYPLPKLDAEVLRTKRPVVSDLFLGAVAKGAPLFAVEGPVLADDTREVRYFLGLSLPVERILTVIEGQRPPPDWTVGVIDGAGVVLARTPRNAEFVGKPANADFMARAVGPEGWWRGATLDGLSVLSGYSRTELAGWVVAAGVPEGSLGAPLRRSVWALATIGLTLAALSGALALAIGRRIAAPIRALARAADALGRGEAVAAVGGPLREAVTVGEALAAASAGLREREAWLLEREASLRESEERLRLIVEGARDHAIVTTDGAGRITGWAPGAEAIFGWRAEEAVGQPVGLFFTPEDRAAGVPAQELETARREGSAADERWHLCKDGSRVFMSGSVRPLHDARGRERGFLKVARDETERHEAERRRAFLLALNDRLRDLARPDEILGAAADALGRHLGVSRVGYGEVDASETHVTVERDWTDGTVGSTAGRHRIADFGPAIIGELRRGATVRVGDVAADARTADWAAAFAALEARALLRVPLVKEGRLTALVYVHHREPRAWSDADAELAREVAERTWSALGRARAEAELRRLNEGLEDQIAERTRELVAEMAKREEAEAQLRQAQKIEALGQLTGGVAHDFNNLLQAIVGSLELLGRGLANGSGSERARRHVDNATEAAMRAAALTRRLLAFARRQALSPEPLDVNRLVTGMSDLLRRTIAVENIGVETALAGGLWRAHADPNQLESAIVNLAVNARDAMPGGGKIRVETANARLDAAYARARPEVAAGEYVMVALSDTGAGMPADVAARAFDPFFTTKAVGQGTGLGLSQVYGFARQSGGHAEIESEPGRGTTVRLYLPRHAAAVVEAVGAGGEARPAARPDPPRGRGETILVVDDDEAVRRAAAEALGELGYRVLEAGGADGALALLDAHPEVALLLTDVVMPGVDGRRLAVEAAGRRPGLKVLFVTGYAGDAVVRDGALDPTLELLGKPFTLETLAGKVRAVLRSGHGGGGDGSGSA
jgi:PAS domain S-box-containing protein